MLPLVAWKLCQICLVLGLVVVVVLSSAEWMNLPQDLDCVGIFGGVGSIVVVVAEKGLRSATYDILRIPGITDQTEDITTLQDSGERLLWCCGWLRMAFCCLPLTVHRGSL